MVSDRRCNREHITVIAGQGLTKRSASNGGAPAKGRLLHLVEITLQIRVPLCRSTPGTDESSDMTRALRLECETVRAMHS